MVTVGGMSTPSGSVLVTSSGDVVGSTTPNIFSGGGGGSGGNQLDLSREEALRRDAEERARQAQEKQARAQRIAEQKAEQERAQMEAQTQQALNQEQDIFRSGGRIVAGGTLIDTRNEKERGLPGFGSALVESGSITFQNVKSAFTIGGPPFENPLNPFKGRGVASGQKEFTDVIETEVIPGTGIKTGVRVGTGRTRREELIRQELLAGIDEDLVGLPTKVQTSKTLERTEVKVQEQVQGNFNTDVDLLQKEFQGRVDQGIFTLEQAQTGLDLAVEQRRQQREAEADVLFQRKAGSDISVLSGRQASIKDAQLKDLGKTSGDIFAETTPKVLETGALVAASATPTGSVIAGGLLIGGSSKDFGRAVLGDDLTISERAGSFGIGTLKFGAGGLFTRSALGPQTRLIDIDGGGSVRIPDNLIERQFIREQFRDLANTRPFLKGRAPVTKDGFIETRFTGGRGTPEITQELDITLRQFESGAVTGKGFSDVTLTTVFDKVRFPTQTFTLGTKGIPTNVNAPISLFGGGVETSTGAVGSGSFGTGTIRFGGNVGFSEFPFVGVGQRTPRGIATISGRQTLGRIPLNRRAFAGDIPINVKSDVPFSIRGSKDVFTFTPLKPEGGGFERIFSGGTKGGRIGTENIIQQELTSSAILGPVVKESTVKSFSGVVTKPLPGPDAFGVLTRQQSAFEGTGQFERTISPGRTRLNVQETLIKPPKFNEFQGSFVFLDDSLAPKQPPNTRDRGRGRGRFFSGESLTPAQVAGQFNLQGSAQVSRLKLRQEQLTALDAPPFTPSFTFRGRGRGGNFGIDLPGLGFQDISPRGRPSKQKKKRQPSLVAAALGIEGPEIKSFEETGLFIRPL